MKMIENESLRNDEEEDEIDDSFSSGSNSPNHRSQRHAAAVAAAALASAGTGSSSSSKSFSRSSLDLNRSAAKPNEKMAEMFCSMLDMLKSSSDVFASKLVLMSQSPPVCVEMREYGYLSVLVELLHQHSIADNESKPATPTDPSNAQLTIGPDTETFLKSLEFRRNTAKALRNIVHNTKKDQNEIKILQLLDDLRSFCDVLYLNCDELSVDSVDHPCAQLAEIVRISADQEYKQMIELFGGVYVITDVIKTDYKFHHQTNNESCYQLSRYSLMILTNLTLDNSRIKSQLGSMRSFMTVLVAFFQTPSEELIQWTANLFRNLAWKSDYSSKQMLRDVKSVSSLAQTALRTTKESTLKAILAALWNLTAHSKPNKADFCKVDGALEFVISTLAYNGNLSGGNGGTGSGHTSMVASTISTNSSGIGTSTLSTNLSSNGGVTQGSNLTTSSGSSSTSSAAGSNSSNCSTIGCSPSSLVIIESGGGILRNLSSFIATSSDQKYRDCLRQLGVVPILLDQLKSPSLPIVTNACITLSHLSASCSQDQQLMLDLGTVAMMHNLTNSKHKMIQVGASATLKNLLTSPVANLTTSSLSHHSFHSTGNNNNNNSFIDGSTTASLSNSKLSLAPLQYRKLQDLKLELSSCLSQNFDHQQLLLGDSPNSSPTHTLHPRHHQNQSHSQQQQQQKQHLGPHSSGRSLNRSATLTKLSSGSSSSPGVTSSQSFTTNMSMCGSFSAGKQQQQPGKKAENNLSAITGPNSSQFHKVSRSSSHDSIGSTHSEPVPKPYRSGNSSNGGNTVVSGILDSPHQSQYNNNQSSYSSFTNGTGKSGGGSSMLYATLPANSRICDNSLIGSGGGSTIENSLLSEIGSDFDNCCGDVNCHPTSALSQSSIINNSTSSSFLASTTESLTLEENLDPEPTDYSQRYKEQPVDDFTAPRRPRSVSRTVVGSGPGTGPSHLHHHQHHHQLAKQHQIHPSSHHHPNPHQVHHQRQQSESSGECEDSVKVYQTEGTPLAFSLAPSLSDLRHVDLKQQLHTAVPVRRNFDQDDEDQEDPEPLLEDGTIGSSVDSNNNDSLSTATNEIPIKKPSPEKSVVFKKPAPPPKPNLPVAPSSSDNKKMMVAPVAAKRLSKLSGGGKTQRQSPLSVKLQVTNLEEAQEEEQDYENLDEYRRIGDELKRKSLKVHEKESEDPKKEVDSKVNGKSDEGKGNNSAEDNILTNGISSNNKENLNLNGDIQKNVNGNLVQNGSNNANGTDQNDESSEDDDEILQECIQFAMPVQKKRIFKRHSSTGSGTGASPHHSPFSHHSQRLSHQLPQSHMSQHLLSQQTPPHHHNLYDQKKRFYVEDTPVQFSECHSPLSSLSFDSDDQDDELDKRLLDATINCGMSTNNNNNTNHSNHSSHDYQNSNSSYPVNAAICNNNNNNGPSVPKDTAIPPRVVPNSNNNNKPNCSDQQPQQSMEQNLMKKKQTSLDSGNGHLLLATDQQQQLQQQQQRRQNSLGDNEDNVDDDDDEEDDRTYTVCAQSTRLLSATTTNVVTATNTDATVTATAPIHSKTTQLTNSNSKLKTATKNPSNSPQSDRSVQNPELIKSKMSDISTHSDIDLTKPPSALYDENLMMITSTDSFGLRQMNRSQPDGDQGILAGGRKSPATGVEIDEDEDGLCGDEDDEMFGAPSQASLLDNTKPPSIIDHSSLMSQSTASITSEISDIAIDQVPIRRTSGNSESAVAAAASSYAKEINNLVKSMNDSSGHHHRSQHSHHHHHHRYNRKDHGSRYPTDLTSSTTSLSSSSSDCSLDNRTKDFSNQITKSSDDLLTTCRTREYRDPQLTFQLEPTPNLPLSQQPQPQTSRNFAQQHVSRSLPRRSSKESSSSTKGSNSNQVGTIGSRVYSTSNTRTYNKTGTTGAKKQLPPRNYPDTSSVDCLSDTDISETLPLDNENTGTGPVGNINSNASKQRHQPALSPSNNKPPIVSNVMYKKPMGSPKLSEQFPPPLHQSHSNSSKPINPHNNPQYSSHHHQFQFDHHHQHSQSQQQNNSSAAEIVPSHAQLSPFGCQSQSGPGSSSSSLRRNSHHHGHTKSQKQSMKADFEDKDLLFTAQHKNQVHATHAQYFQQQQNSNNQANPTIIMKTASKYFDRHGFGSGLGSGSSSLLRNQRVINDEGDQGSGNVRSQRQLHSDDSVTNCDQKLASSTGGGGGAATAAAATNSSSAKSGSTPTSKPSKSSSILSNVKSRLTASLSSHNLGSSSQSPSNSSLISSSKSSSRKIEVKSKIAFWKRSKSTHDKLDSAAATPGQANSGATSPTKGKDGVAPDQLNRSINSRRSFGKSAGSFDIANNNNGDGAANPSVVALSPSTTSSNKIIRSSTYEKLPLNDEEALKMNTNNNNSDEEHFARMTNLGSNRLTGAPSADHKFNTFHYGSTNGGGSGGHSSSSRSRAYTPTTADKLNGNSNEFTFTTFVKSYNNQRGPNNVDGDTTNNNNNNSKGIGSKLGPRVKHNLVKDLQLMMTGSSSSSSSSGSSLPALSGSNSSLNLTPTQSSVGNGNEINDQDLEIGTENQELNTTTGSSGTSSSTNTTATNIRKTCLVTTV